MLGEQLHCDDGPAVFWPGGAAYWFLHGARVPRELVETPAGVLDPQLLLRERNAEVRREIVRKIGIARICRDLGARVVDRDLPMYELLELDLGDGRRRPYLSMINPSSGDRHVEGVHPDCHTVAAALQWRTGMRTRPMFLS